MDEQEDLLSKIMDAGQPEMPDNAPETEAEAETAAEAAGQGLSSGDYEKPSPDVSRETSAQPERNRRTLIRVGYAVAALLAANLLALLAMCLIQYRANQTAMDAVGEALENLQTVERLEQEKEKLQERIGELEEMEKDLRGALADSEEQMKELTAAHEHLILQGTVALYLWRTEGLFEEGEYEQCAAILRYLLGPVTGVEFGLWDDYWDRTARMVEQLEEMGYLEEGDTIIPYYSSGTIDLGTATVNGDG